MKIREIAKHSPLQEGAIADKVIPGIGFADIGIRAAQDDYPGAAIAGAAAGLGLIPTPITRGASIGLDVFNQLRDLAKERGGWGNLGRDIYQSIKTQEYDPSFLPEEFANLDQLDRRGQLDEGGVRDIFTKYGPEAYQWLKKAITRKKPDVPTTKPPLNAAEREAAERAEELAAREAEKQTKVVDRRGQPKQDEVPIVNKDAPAAPSSAEQPLPKWDKKVHKSEEDYLSSLTRSQAERYKLNKEILATQGAPVKPGWVRRAGGWVLDNPIKTMGGLGTGYYLTPDPVKDFVKDKVVSPVTDYITDKAKADAAKVIQANQDRIKELEAEKEKYRQEQERRRREEQERENPAQSDQSRAEPSGEKNEKSADTPKQSAPPPQSPMDREEEIQKKQGLPYSSLDSEDTTDKVKTLAEKYQQFLNDDKKPQYTKEQFIQLAAKYAKQYDVPLPVVLHAMRKETGAYDANTAATIRGPKTPYGQAVGVMQLMPSFFKTLKPEDLENPDRNIEAGTKFLANLYKTYGSAEAALAAYNAGPYNKKFKAWLKSNDPRDLPAQTREYLYGDTRKKTVGYVDDVAQQVALLNPPSTRDKVVKVATDVLAAATGSGDAQAANSKKSKAEVISGPQYPPHGTPIEKVQLPGHWTNPVLKPIDGRVHMQLQDLSGEFKAALDKAMADYAKDNPGVTITVTSGVRTPEDQKALAKRAAIEYEKMKRGEPNNYIPASKELAGHAGYAIDMNTPDLVKFSKWLRKNDPYDKKNPSNTKYGLQDGFEIADRVHLQLRGYEQLDSEKARRAYNKNLPIDKQILTAADWESYVQRTEAEKLALAQPKDKKLTDPGLGGSGDARADSKQAAPVAPPQMDIDLGADLFGVIKPGDLPKTSGNKSAEKKAEKPADKPADKDKPKAKTRTTTDATGRETTYTQNEKGQWVDPRGNIMPTPEKPGSRKDLEITDKGGEPSAADVEKSRNITGRKDPLIDPDTGFPTTEKALRDKLAQRAADEKAAADKEAKRIADLEKIQRDAEARKKAEKPADKEAGKADAGTGLAGTDKGKGKATDVRPDPNAAKGLAGTDKGGDKKARVEPPKSVAPKVDAPAADADKQKTKINVRKEFEKAFAAARAQQVIDTGKGSGGTFTWTNPLTGKEGLYTTDYGDEVKTKVIKKDTKGSSGTDITSKDAQDLARRASQFKPEPEKVDEPEKSDSVDPRLSKIPYDVVRKQVKPDYTVDADPDALKVPSASAVSTAVEPEKDDVKSSIPTRSIAEPDRANVLRSTDGTPVRSGTGEPWGTGTSTKDDLERAKAELQRKIDDEKAKKELEKIAPDLSKLVEPEDTFQDKWNRGIDTLTGNRRPPDDRDKIRVPESVNTELKDILWLAGRVKR
jgi:hypothetical protein